MRASVIVCIFVIALLGLGLRARSGSTLRAPTKVHAQDRREAKPTKEQKNPKAPMPPPEADAPKPPEADAPKAPPEPEPPKQANPLIHREPKTKSVEPPKVLWYKELTGEARTTNQAAHQAVLEAAALELGVFLKEKYPAFRWTPTAEFVNDMIVDEKEEAVQLELADAPPLVKNTIKVELRDSHLKAALQEDRKVRVESRLWQAGRGLGGLLIILVAIIGYVRLDDWTKGYLSFPLKLTALTVAVAGPIALWWLI